MGITAKGRELIGKVNEYLRTTYGAKIVYGDTDSCMVDLNISDPKDCHMWGKKLSEEISGNPLKGVSGLFPPPLKIEFEKAMRLLCLKKKMYAAFLIDKNGNYKTSATDILKKGIILARRDKCKWVCRVYLQLLHHILLKGSLEEAFDIIIDAIQKLISGNVSYKDLIFIRELGSNYKSDTYFMKVFADQLRKIGKPANPGDRLEYIIVTSDKETGTEKIGMKMRLPETYLERLNTSEEEKIDYFYYLEHSLMNPIDTLMEVAYSKELMSFESFRYKPKGRYHFKSFKEPVKMMIFVLKDGGDISLIRYIIRRKILPPKIRVIDPDNINETTNKKCPRLRIVTPPLTKVVLE